MRGILAGTVALLALGACGHMSMAGMTPAHHEVTADAPYIVAAVSDSHRPQADKDTDVNRKPAEMLAFAQIHPGQRVGDLNPGGGYFTRLFAVAVGPQGHVYALASPPAADAPNPPPPPRVAAVAADYQNVTVVRQPYASLSAPEPLDMVWTSQNYHDFKIPANNLDTVAIDRAVFGALKPGGVFIVLDHSAPDGSGATLTPQLHRIDQALVRHEVESVGFVYDGETQVLRNPADPRTAPVFDDSIRHHTDQFVMRFRKPG